MLDEFQETYYGILQQYLHTWKAEPTLLALRQSLLLIMNQYARELGILKEKDKNFTGADVRNGMTAVLSS